jgi:hypothetical protein
VVPKYTAQGPVDRHRRGLKSRAERRMSLRDRKSLSIRIDPLHPMDHLSALTDICC